MTQKLYKSAAVGMLLLAVSLLVYSSAESVDQPFVVLSTDFEDWFLGEDGASKGFFTVRFPFGGILQNPTFGFVAEKPAGNKAYRLSERQRDVVFVSDKDLSDFVLSFGVEIVSGGYAVFFRVDPGNDGYMLDGGALGTMRNLATTGTPKWFARESSLLPSPGKYVVRLVVIGKNILVFRNAARVISASNELFSHGIIGLAESGQGAIYVDELNIKQLIGVKAVRASGAPPDGGLHIAIVSTEAFDAPSELDLATLTFGKTGEERSLGLASQGAGQACQTRDDNADGREDLVCRFDPQLAGLTAQDPVGVLFGLTQGGYLVGAIVDL